MRRIIVQEFITLDGIMQAPGGPEEDEAGQFKYGGWTAPYFAAADEAAGPFMGEWMKSTDILLGRKTFDIFAAYWPQHTEMWPGIQDVTKYVASTTLTENKSDWQNVTFLGDIEAIKQLKEGEGSDLKVHGSGNLAQSLLEHGLVDEIHLITFPIVLGSGKRLFGDNSVASSFSPLDSLVTPNGVIFANYTRTGGVETARVGE